MAQFISIGEAAKYIGVSRDTLRRWEKAGKIKPQRSPTNRRYYTKSQLDQLIGKQPAPSKGVKAKGIKRPGPLKLITFGLAAFLIAAIIAFIAIMLLV